MLLKNMMYKHMSTNGLYYYEHTIYNNTIYNICTNIYVQT